MLFCFVLFSLQLSVCLWWHDYRRDGFPTLKFVVVIADLLAIRRERSPLHCVPPPPKTWQASQGVADPLHEGDQLRLGVLKTGNAQQLLVWSATLQP